jgi:transposase
MSKYGTGRLSDCETGQVIALTKQDLLMPQIEKEVNRPRSTIQSFVERYHERGPPKNLDAPGRPQKIGDTRRRLIQETKKVRRQPLRELGNRVIPGMSVRTVKRVLEEEGIKKWRAKTRDLLKAEHRILSARYVSHALRRSERCFQLILSFLSFIYFCGSLKYRPTR